METKRVACRKIEIKTELVNEGFVKTPIEPRKPAISFREAEAGAEAGRIKYFEAEAQAESIKNSI